jgi:hypothetical protein
MLFWMDSLLSVWNSVIIIGSILEHIYFCVSTSI